MWLFAHQVQASSNGRRWDKLSSFLWFTHIPFEANFQTWFYSCRFKYHVCIMSPYKHCKVGAVLSLHDCNKVFCMYSIFCNFSVIKTCLIKKFTYFPKICYNRKLQDSKLNRISVFPTSQVCLVTMLVYFITESLKMPTWTCLKQIMHVLSHTEIGQSTIQTGCYKQLTNTVLKEGLCAFRTMTVHFIDL